MTATGETTGPAVPPALPPRIYRSVSTDVPHTQPLKPPKRSKKQEYTSVSGICSEAIYEDPDALLTSNPDVNQPEAKPRPMARPRSKAKPNPQLDTNNTTKENYTNTINSGHNDNTAVTGYVTKTAFDANTTQTTNNTSSSTRSTKTTYETGTTANANTASRRSSSTTSSTVNSTYDAVRTNKTHNANPAKSSDKTGDTKTDASHQNGKNSNDYMTPRSARQALLPPLAPESKGSYSTAADASQDYITRTNSNTSVKNPPPLPPPRLDPINSHYCDKVNPTPQSSETSSLYDMGPRSGSSLHTDNVNPQDYIIVLPDYHYNGLLTHARRDEDDNQSTYSDIYQLTQDDVTELLQWLKRVSRQSDTMLLYGLSMEDEMRSFYQQAMHVRKARRLYNLLMKKRKEPLQKILDEFKAICEKLENVQKINKTMGIAGGTTSAVGGVTAVVGIALAPVTMGASLIATAVGAGIVATSAGGFAAKVAKANKKIVNRETVEKLVDAYKSDVADLEHCLNYILYLVKELQRHNTGKLSRAGAHPDALRMAELSKAVSNKSQQVSPNNPGWLTSENMLKQFELEFDEYFTEKKGQKLKKSNKSKFSARVGTLVKTLQEELNYLDEMWELLT